MKGGKEGKEGTERKGEKQGKGSREEGSREGAKKKKKEKRREKRRKGREAGKKDEGSKTGEKSKHHWAPELLRQSPFSLLRKKWTVQCSAVSCKPNICLLPTSCHSRDGKMMESKRI